MYHTIIAMTTRGLTTISDSETTDYCMYIYDFVLIQLFGGCVSLQYVIKTKHNQQPRGKAIFSEGVCSIEVR